MGLDSAILLATVIVFAGFLTSYHLRVSKLRRQESENIQKRRDITPPLIRQGEASEA